MKTITVTEDIITEVIDDFEKLDETSLTKNIDLFFKHQPDIMNYVHIHFHELEFEEQLQFDITDLLLIIWMAYGKVTRNIPKVTIEELEATITEDEAIESLIAEELNLDINDNSTFDILEKINNDLANAEIFSKEDFNAILEKYNLAGISSKIEKMRIEDPQPYLTGLVFMELEAIEHQYRKENMLHAFNLLMQIIKAMHKAINNSRLRIVN